MTSQNMDQPSEHEIVSCADWPERPTYGNGLRSDAATVDVVLSSHGNGCNEVQEREIQIASQSRWR